MAARSPRTGRPCNRRLCSAAGYSLARIGHAAQGTDAHCGGRIGRTGRIGSGAAPADANFVTLRQFTPRRLPTAIRGNDLLSFSES